MLRDLGVDATPQVWIRTRLGAKRVDALLDDRSVVLEFDGAVKYSSSRTSTPLEDRAEKGDDNPLFAEKVREDAIRDEDFEVVRVVWSQLDAPGDIRRRIDAAVARSSRRAV